MPFFLLSKPAAAAEALEPSYYYYGIKIKWDQKYLSGFAEPGLKCTVCFFHCFHYKQHSNHMKGNQSPVRIKPTPLIFMAIALPLHYSDDLEYEV